jgi:hypothetical protein
MQAKYFRMDKNDSSEDSLTSRVLAVIRQKEQSRREAEYRDWCDYFASLPADFTRTLEEGLVADVENRTVSFFRKKTGVPVLVHLGSEALNLFKDLPGEGPLFPRLSRVRAGDRATEFGQRCRQLGIKGVTLHSHRYAWAERAKTCGYPERFAQEALGHNSKAVHRAYARRAIIKIPSLEDYQKRIVPLRSAVNQ